LKFDHCGGRLVNKKWKTINLKKEFLTKILKTQQQGVQLLPKGNVSKVEG
jgi:hypothetical protein